MFVDACPFHLYTFPLHAPGERSAASFEAPLEILQRIREGALAQMVFGSTARKGGAGSERLVHGNLQ